MLVFTLHLWNRRIWCIRIWNFIEVQSFPRLTETRALARLYGLTNMPKHYNCQKSGEAKYRSQPTKNLVQAFSPIWWHWSKSRPGEETEGLNAIGHKCPVLKNSVTWSFVKLYRRVELSDTYDACVQSERI